MPKLNIDWVNLPYDHTGRWSKKYTSVMNPNSEDKITFPQWIAENVVWNRSQIPTFPEHGIRKGKGWYDTISTRVRNLNQQAATICKYFPHPDDEPLIFVAINRFLQQNKIIGLGGYRKYRTKKTKYGNVCTVSQIEKDFVKGVTKILQDLEVQRVENVDKPPVPATTGSTDRSFRKTAKVAGVFDRLK